MKAKDLPSNHSYLHLESVPRIASTMGPCHKENFVSVVEEEQAKQHIRNNSTPFGNNSRLESGRGEI